MAVAIWPLDLPQRALVEGYSEQPANILLRSQTDIGPAKVRARSSAGIEPLTAVLSLQLWQAERLRRFFREEIAMGALPFFWPDQRLDGAALVDADGVTALTDETGRVLLASSRQLVRMTQPPVITPQPRPSVTWRAQLQLEVLP